MGAIGESDNPSSRKAWTTLRAVLWTSDCGNGARAWGAHAFAGARAAMRHLEPLVITRSIVSASRSNHRRSPQCSECRRLIMPIGTATGRMWTSTWAPIAGSHGRLGDGRSRCDHELRSSFRLRSCPTVSRGHLESGDSPPVHRFLGFPRPASGAMHHFLNGMPRLTHSHFRRACFCVNHKTSGSRPSRSEASHLDFPLEIASEAFNPANFFAARPSSCTISYPETGKCVAAFLNVRVS